MIAVKAGHEAYEQAWLGYRRLEDEALRARYAAVCGRLIVVGEGAGLASARLELRRAIKGLLGCEPVDLSAEAEAGVGDEGAAGPAIVVGLADAVRDIWVKSASGAAGMHAGAGAGAGATEMSDIGTFGDEDYAIRSGNDGSVYLLGGGEKGVLYAAFGFIRLLQTGGDIRGLQTVERPAYPLRMIDHWDNADGSVERGYAGGSLFFNDGRLGERMDRIRDYARLTASIGINAVAVNNVNVHAEETRLLAPERLADVARVADVLREYGIALYLSVNFAAPIELGGLVTADPLDTAVAAWWRDTTDEVCRRIPGFGGYVVKADSEHRPGPFTYGRDHADGANMLADALAPHGGTVIWRCFVYDCKQDWRDRRTDRACAAHDHFMPLDGAFHDNVVLQIKHGPMDFQVREPVSPLLLGLRRTQIALELQVTQEYTGQQRHLCYLLPMWKEVLDFDGGDGRTVADAAGGLKREAGLEARGGGADERREWRGGLAAVANVGTDLNWTGHLLAQANWYGFGRLAWNPSASAEAIGREWIRMALGLDPTVEETVIRMLMDSHAIYESYTAPLGVGWMVNPNHHYGPNVDGYEYSPWGTYHYADRYGIGVDRSVATGTGYAGQYPAFAAAMYETPQTCPDELLLFFHHVSYDMRLKSGKTVIQHIYDTRFEGAERAAGLLTSWDSIADRLPARVYVEVRERLACQAEHAQEWRDQLNSYFYRKSGIPDARGRTIY
ncbi:alpha-glucuronidase family glycosyl hydrolase [Cohnella hashimotonis]|uniref:Xylan alpha-1,2-glucuronidase n=1 Tax=Cohnella hashimotonis TaxID=2826895 RepID=A0ABT6TLR0_9BACL|nr:alpha-glucuronidase family glycosyl hydrolase [Cohnella hashimotonis]MDI4647792.1 alpha-glucuronidase family glycosyl hydrolase [Cohnella hashimotonis]